MAFGWTTKRVLIVVKTYPAPAHKGVEVSCTAGISQERQWRRLFPGAVSLSGRRAAVLTLLVD
jgi:hypothetical protein